jgi:hypothetical protein
MSARVRAYIDEVDAAATNNPAVSRKTVYSALGGSQAEIDAIEAVAPGLLDGGRGMMDDLRDLANTTSGRDGGFLGRVDNHVPRTLTGEAREKVRQGLVNRGRNTPRFRGNMAEPKGSELGRKYITKQDFERKVTDYRKKNPSVSKKDAERFVRSDGGGLDPSAVQTDFWGTELLEPNTPIGSVDPKTGQEILAGSVEDQIADILVASGADYMLFTDDLQVALDGYINQVSHRAGQSGSPSCSYCSWIIGRISVVKYSHASAKVITLGRLVAIDISPYLICHHYTTCAGGSQQQSCQVNVKGSFSCWAL